MATPSEAVGSIRNSCPLDHGRTDAETHSSRVTLATVKQVASLNLQQRDELRKTNVLFVVVTFDRTPRFALSARTSTCCCNSGVARNNTRRSATSGVRHWPTGLINCSIEGVSVDMAQLYHTPRILSRRFQPQNAIGFHSSAVSA